jgi:hypothetical protein
MTNCMFRSIFLAILVLAAVTAMAAAKEFLPYPPTFSLKSLDPHAYAFGPEGAYGVEVVMPKNKGDNARLYEGMGMVIQLQHMDCDKVVGVASVSMGAKSPHSWFVALCANGNKFHLEATGTTDPPFFAWPEQ